MISDQTRRQKSREVSSRYLSPIVAPPSPPLAPNSKPSSSTKQKHKHTGFIRGLWPSSSTHSSKSQKENPPTTTGAATLADHLGSERRKDGVKRSGNSPLLSKQKSCTEFRRSEHNSNTKSILKEYHYHTPIHGGKLMFSGRSSISSSTSSSSTRSAEVFDSNQVILPGRLSVDENALRRRSSYYEMRSDTLSDNSESSDLGSPFATIRNSPSPASYMAPTMSSRKSRVIEVPSMHNSPNKSTLKTAMKRANSLSSSSEWESSPSRFGSPSFSSSKPPSSTKKNLLHMGLDLIKGKKGGSRLGLDTRKYMIESVHQLRLLQNSWMQWRYVNARAQAVHQNLAAECENKLSCTRESMTRLRQSVVQKRLQLQKEKLDMKLNLILHSQTKMLEAWEKIETRHSVDVSIMKDYLHTVVCMIPLIEGAKVDLESTSMAFQHTSHMVATIKSMLSSISPKAHETISTLSELAEVVAREKLLLEECFEHLRVISTLEIQERNLRCSIIAMDSLNQQQQQQQM
ncbi:QWRF motif-containing protein 3-like [Cynara cardunculus var. scolymus]|uniref:QWRF motif-containing protein 3-like n=1 Tax=Cynara cardunculus var. scolymus TaxID=59895 RepID=UPI000D629B6B|nr:QWRF motif-containing protein 3-like [Cynara cardunculus var. scolymus]